MRRHLWMSSFLVAAAVVTTFTPNFETSSLNVATAHAQSRYISEFEREFERRKSVIESDLARGKVSSVDIERTKKELEPILRSMKGDGLDPGPYRKRYQDYLAALPGRLAKAQAKIARKAISRKIPRVAPEPGVETIAAGKPAWCNDIVEKMQKLRMQPSKSLKLPNYASEIDFGYLGKVAYFACSDPEFDLIQKWTQAYRQRLTNLTGLTQKQSDALFALVTSREQPPPHQRRRSRDAAYCAKFPELRDGLTEDRISRSLERAMLGCGRSSAFRPKIGRLNLNFPSFPFWFVDTVKGPQTQLARLGLMGSLLVSRGAMLNVMASPSQPRDASLMMQNFAIAKTIKVDLSKMVQEIQALGLEEDQAWMIRFRTFGVLRAMARAEALTRSFVDANPGYETVFFSGPAKAAQANIKAAAKHKPLLEKLVAIEDRINPSKAGGLNGCAQSLFADFEPWVKKQVKANKKQNFEDFSFDGYPGSLLLYGLMFCASNDPNAVGLTNILMRKYGRTNIVHGPISATYLGMVDAYNELQDGKASTTAFSTRRRGSGSKVRVEKLFWSPVTVPKLERDLSSSRNIGRLKGVIKSIRKKGDRVVVTFKTIKYKQDIRKCKDTNKISYIGDNGIVYYQQSCKTVGTRTVRATNDPVEFPAWAAKGLKKGQFMVYEGENARSYAEKSKGLLRRGWPHAVFKSKAQKKLVSLFGVKL